MTTRRVEGVSVAGQPLLVNRIEIQHWRYRKTAGLLLVSAARTIITNEYMTKVVPVFWTV